MEIGEEFDVAIEAKDKEFLSKIFGFAEWCIRCTGPQVENLIITFFYKIVFMTMSEDRGYLLQWVSPCVYTKIEWYLSAKFEGSVLIEARDIIEHSEHELYRENWYHVFYGKQV